ncbi:MAG: hypothetical protein GVY32_06605, partial [Gammaproteobacteria bacterium]|nr:hypothetical protein [Gammaproteobacteria bacterium]
MQSERAAQQEFTERIGLLGRVGGSLLTALAVALPALLLVPIQIHALNPYDFEAALADLFPGVMILSLAATLALSLPLLVLPRRSHAGGVS